MSRIRFDSLTAENPDLREALNGLDRWFAQNPRASFVEVGRLGRELPELPVYQLAVAMNLLVREGVVRLVYKVTDPDGSLVEGEFSSPAEIPEKLPNRFHTAYFNTAEGDIVPGFSLEPMCARK